MKGSSRHFATPSRLVLALLLTVQVCGPMSASAADPQSFWNRLFGANRSSRSNREAELRRQREMQQQMLQMRAQQLADQQAREEAIRRARQQASTGGYTDPSERAGQADAVAPEPTPAVETLVTPYGTSYGPYQMQPATTIKYDTRYGTASASYAPGNTPASVASNAYPVRYSSYSPGVTATSRDNGRQVMSISTQIPASVYSAAQQGETFSTLSAPSVIVLPRRSSQVRDWVPRSRPDSFTPIKYNPFATPAQEQEPADTNSDSGAADAVATYAKAAGGQIRTVGNRGSRQVKTATVTPQKNLPGKPKDKLDVTEPAGSNAGFTGAVPTAVPVREGRVSMPFPPYTVLNVEGMASGSIAKDPTSERMFRVP